MYRKIVNMNIKKKTENWKVEKKKKLYYNIVKKKNLAQTANKDMVRERERERGLIVEFKAIKI